MYLKQMGQVPLLTREQEVEISKRIEDAEARVQRHLNRFGFIARAHLDLAQKLVEGRERFDRVILDKKIESRERYLKALPKLCEQLEQFGADLSRLYLAQLHGAGDEEERANSQKEFARQHESLAEAVPQVFLQAEGHRGAGPSHGRQVPPAERNSSPRPRPRAITPPSARRTGWITAPSSRSWSTNSGSTPKTSPWNTRR